MKYMRRLKRRLENQILKKKKKETKTTFFI